jgi:hypothetical protein
MNNNLRGERLARLGDRPAGLEAGQFMSPHGLAVDSRGDIYVGEVSFTNWSNRYKGQSPPPGCGFTEARLGALTRRHRQEAS